MKEVTALVELIETDYYEDLVMIVCNGDRKGYIWNPAYSQIYLMVLISPAVIVNVQLLHLWPHKGKGTKGFNPLDYSSLCPG